MHPSQRRVSTLLGLIRTRATVARLPLADLCMHRGYNEAVCMRDAAFTARHSIRNELEENTSWYRWMGESGPSHYKKIIKK